MKNMRSSSVIYYNNLLNILFGSYLADTHMYEFDRPTASKLHSGKIRIDPDMSEFYLNTDSQVMHKDIQELIPYIFDKHNAYRELFELIQYDDSLSGDMRKSILNKLPEQYEDDNSLTEIIFEAVYIAVSRQYEKNDSGYTALKYSRDLSLISDSLFSNSEYVPPCSHFCGRDAELNEFENCLHENSAVILTGIAGIGKSELVRKYVQNHKNDYQYVGYYFYKGSLKNTIANIISNSVIADENLRYTKNLELLSSLKESALLVIDNVNITPESDDCFDDVLNAGCRVVFVSNYHYEDYSVYELKEFRSEETALELISKFYSFSENEQKDLLNIIRTVFYHTFCVYLYAKVMAKGLYTPKTLLRKLGMNNGFHTIAERISAIKDKHPKKKTYYDHIRDLFNLIALPESYQNVLRMMIVTPFKGVRKDFMASMMCLRNMTIIEELIEIGLIQELKNGTITLHSVIRNLIESEFIPDSENCSPIVDSIRTVCVNEALDVCDNAEIIHEMISIAIFRINFQNVSDYIYFLHDCYKFSEHYGISFYTGFLITQENSLHKRNDAKQSTLVLSDSASYEMLKNNYDKALALQEEAMKRSQECEDILLQANTINTYGYYLNLANRKEEALKMMQVGMALFSQLDDDGTFYYDKYRAVINYADLLFAVGQQYEAIEQVNTAVKTLQEYGLEDTEIYADCMYALGLYHVCMNDNAAKNELVTAFRTFISLYGIDSDFVQTRAAELKKYSDYFNNGFEDYELLNRLIEL